MRYLSLFSGIEAATVAWHPLGWECVGVAEIEPFPCAVLAHYYPNVPNLGDVTKLTEEDVALLGPIDLIVFGSPCQDLSVAGKRAGLKGERSGLFYTAVNIIGWAREHCGLRFALWENVPGAFSSNKGADFAVVVGELAGVACDVPPKGWGNEGVLVGEKGMVEWSTLDAQWFGVAQRRRRVFAFADFGDWTGRPPILLEPEGMRGDTAPRREAGQGVAASVAQCLDGSGPRSSSRVGDIRGQDNVVGVGLGVEQPFEVANTLTQRMATSKGINTTVDEGQTPVVTHSLRADGFDAIEDGTGRGTPLIAIPFDTTQITSAANYSNPKAGDPCHPLARGAHAPAIAFTTEQTPKFNHEAALTLTKQSPTGGGQPQAVAFQSSQSGVREVEAHATLDSNNGSRRHNGVAIGMQVRRLTPRECERLQGFPDDYTYTPYRGKPAADGPRYKALGNSMAVPVMRWIGRQIDLIGLFQ